MVKSSLHTNKLGSFFRFNICTSVKECFISEDAVLYSNTYSRPDNRHPHMPNSMVLLNYGYLIMHIIINPVETAFHTVELSYPSDKKHQRKLYISSSIFTIPVFTTFP